jgi:hypothetical protein
MQLLVGFVVAMLALTGSVVAVPRLLLWAGPWRTRRVAIKVSPSVDAFM